MSMINPYAKKRQRQESNKQTIDPPSFSVSVNSTSDNDSNKSRNTATSLPQQENASALIISASNKAGMDGIDRSRIDAIILRESGNSKFMDRQRKQDEQVNVRIQKMKQQLNDLKKQNAHITETTPEIEEQLSSYHRPSRSTAVVVDMDMFFMACELLTKPELRDVPACVGGGMITTSNYCARKYGVRSAMPGFIGDKLVEELSGGKLRLIHVRNNHELYKQKSLLVREALKEYDPFTLSMYSLDEAYLELGPYVAVALQHPTWNHEQIYQCLLRDGGEVQQEGDNLSTNLSTPTGEESEIASGTEAQPPEPKSETTPQMKDSVEHSQQTRKHSGSNYFKKTFKSILESFPCSACLDAASRVVNELRQSVCKNTGGLTCSAGLAPNFMLAKIASDRNKPNGQYVIDPSVDSVLRFVHPLPTRKIPCIGRVTEKTLAAFGISTVRDLYDQRGLVNALFRSKTSRFLLRASVGCDSSSSNDPGDDDDDLCGEGNEDPSSGSHLSQKGISRERTFGAEGSWTELNIRLEDISRKLSQDMVRKNVWARTVTVKVKLHTFDVLSKARSMQRGVFIQAPEELATVATELLKEVRSDYKKKNEPNESKRKHVAGCDHPQNRNEVPNINDSTKIYKPFTCRLLGIRCSNLIQGDSQTNPSFGGQNQLRMDKFLAAPPTGSAKNVAPCDDDSEMRECPSPSPRVREDNGDKSDHAIFSGRGASVRSPYKKLPTCPNSNHQPNHEDSSSLTRGFFDEASRSDADVSSVASDTCSQKFGIAISSEQVGPSAVHRDCQDPEGTEVRERSSQELSTDDACDNASCLSSTKAKGLGKVSCPLCNQPISSKDNDELNRHIDTCLNASTIRAAVREATTASTYTAKKRRLHDFWQKS